MSYWIEVHQDLPGHKKTRKAAKLLKEERAHMVGHMVTLWLWSIDNAPNGRVDEIGSDVLADAAEYHEDADMFLDALIDVGFVDRHEDGTLWLHDWDDYIGKLIAQRAKNAQRMKDARAAEKEEREKNVQRTCGARAPATEQYQTEQERESNTVTDGAPPPTELPPTSRTTLPSPEAHKSYPVTNRIAHWSQANGGHGRLYTSNRYKADCDRDEQKLAELVRLLNLKGEILESWLDAKVKDSPKWSQFSHAQDPIKPLMEIVSAEVVKRQGWERQDAQNPSRRPPVDDHPHVNLPNLTGVGA